jgi:class 3 adenylate cyclase/predicted ATPase
MRCPACHTETAPEADSCPACGSSLATVCRACGTANSADGKFCRECGAALGGRTRAPAASAPDAERRQLTVLFCDLAGSTALSERLDPEEFRDVLESYYSLATDVVRRFEGCVAQYLGDGIMAYFGHPLAHEDDAVRAVRTGLGILDALRALPPFDATGERLHARIGIDTGVVVVGDTGESATNLALGDAPNIAARLQGVAAIDTVVVSATTHRLVAGYFVSESLGVHQLKGISTPMEVHRVTGESAVRSRFDLAVVMGLTPLVGRREEVDVVLRRWEDAKAGRGQVLLIGGEAGIGKSRLVQVLAERTGGDAPTIVHCRCSAYSQNSALYPVIEHLQNVVGLEPEDAPEAKLEKLARRLAGHRFVEPDTVPLLAALLSLPMADDQAPLGLTPQKQKQKTLELLVTWLVEEAERRPVWITVEDLHWADASTLELLGLLIERATTAPLYVVLTFRPDFVPPWSGDAVNTLMLRRLERDEIEEMVLKVTDGRALPKDVLAQIVARTDGVPLFVEELTKMVTESRWLREVAGRFELAGPLPALRIPTTLQESLMARLDQLGPFREVAQLGATLGREFSYDLIRAVSTMEERTLRQGIERLVDAELLYQRGVSPRVHYVFKHALVQHAAYESLLKKRRQQFHRRIAEVLEERFPDVVDARPELLAQHYTGANVPDQAVRYWQRAGETALARSAYVEAVNHLNSGLELTGAMAPSAERTERELALRAALGVGLVTIRGYAAPEVEQNCSRARILCRQLRDLPRLIPTIYGLWSYHLLRDHRAESFELVEQLSDLARSPEHCFLAATVRGTTEFWHGDLQSAVGHLASAVEMYDPDYPRAFAPHFSEDVPLLAQAYYAWCLFFLGRPDQARVQCTHLKTLAGTLASPYLAATALHFELGLVQSLRDVAATRDVADRMIALSTEQQFPTFLASGLCARGWVTAQDGDVGAGLAQMRQGLAVFEAAGLLLGLSYWRSHLVEAGLGHEPVEALATIVDAELATARSGLTRYYDSELHRLRGELFLAQSDRAGAEHALRVAVQIARERGANALALRPAMALARLLERAEASSLLAKVYEAFDEGFESRELVAAKALLDELS